MVAKKTGGPAFPVTKRWMESYMDGSGYDRKKEVIGLNGGMTLRDYFAAAALQGIIANGPNAQLMDVAQGLRGGKHEVEAAYVWADAMLAERERSDK